MGVLAPCLSAQPVRVTLEPVASGLNQPVYLTNAHDGTDRRFIVEQLGRISVMQPGSSTRTTFLDISNRVLCCGERGLLGLAFHPQYAANRKFYVNYTRRPDGATVVAEYQANVTNQNTAATLETVLFVVPQPYENHNGGMVEFGNDGYLYVGMGDGGSGNDPQNHAQNPADLLGKILRIDVNAAAPRPEVYALGMRNPWRFSFDRATGQLYVGDVGQGVIEEVDIITQGGNYGWRVLEGTRCTNLGPGSCSNQAYIPPIAQYDHATNGRCSITGGYVYRGALQSLPYGAYIYGDYCSGEVFLLQSGVSSVLTDTTFNISSFGEDEAGELYVVSLGGTIYRIRNPDAFSTPTAAFNLANRGALSITAAGAPALRVGYSRIQVCCGAQLPEGMAIFGYRSNGVLVSEASVPAAPLISSGRIFAEVQGGVNTGIAIANPATTGVTVSYSFIDTTGNTVKQGTAEVGPGRQLSVFLNEAPFNITSPFEGTFTFNSDKFVSAIALRGLTNERSEFLVTTLPIAPLERVVDSPVIPHFSDGGGWTTDLVLVNKSENEINRGTITWLDREGQAIAGLSPTSYSVPPRSVQRFKTPGTAATIQTGSVRLAPNSIATSSGGRVTDLAPAAAAIFRYKSAGITVTEAAVPAASQSGTYRMFVENLGDAIQTGIAMTSLGNQAIVNLDLLNLDGSPTGISSTLTIPAGGQRALFLKQIPGFASVPARFQGVLRATGSSGSFTMTGLRGRYNERGEFLITTTSTVGSTQLPQTSELLFPHFALGGGYEMQFVLISGRNDQPASGTIYFFDQAGLPMTIPFR